MPLPATPYFDTLLATVQANKLEINDSGELWINKSQVLTEAIANALIHDFVPTVQFLIGAGQILEAGDIYQYIDDQIALLSGGSGTSFKIDDGTGGGRYLNWFFGYTSNTSNDDAGFLDLATFASVGQNNDAWLHIPLISVSAQKWVKFKSNISTISDIQGDDLEVSGKVTSTTLSGAQTSDSTRAKLQLSNGQVWLSHKFESTYHAQIRIDQYINSRSAVIGRTDFGQPVFSLSDIAP